jgi:Ribbon-helix-helix protein, copG family
MSFRPVAQAAAVKAINPVQLLPNPQEKPPMVRTNIFLTAPQIAALQAMAQATGLSVAELVRRAIDLYLTPQQIQ